MFFGSGIGLLLGGWRPGGARMYGGVLRILSVLAALSVAFACAGGATSHTRQSALGEEADGGASRFGDDYRRPMEMAAGPDGGGGEQAWDGSRSLEANAAGGGAAQQDAGASRSEGNLPADTDGGSNGGKEFDGSAGDDGSDGGDRVGAAATTPAVRDDWTGFFQGAPGPFGPLVLLPGGFVTYGAFAGASGRQVLRYRTPSALEWAVSVPSPGAQTASSRTSFNGLAADAMQVYLSGSSDQVFDGEPEKSSQYTTPVLSRLDADGNLEWTRQLTPLQARDVFVSIDAGGHAILTGAPIAGYGRAVDIHPSPPPVLGPPCFFVAKYGPDGDLRWMRRWSGACRRLWSSAVDASGNTYALLGGIDPRDGGYLSIMIKVSPEGDLVWSRRRPSGGLHPATRGYPLPTTMTVSPDGQRVYVGGSSTLDWSRPELPSNGDFERPFVAAFDANGEHLWGRVLQIARVEPSCRRLDCFGLIVPRIAASDDAVFLLGHTKGFIDGSANPDSLDQLVLFRFNAEGGGSWAKQIAADDSDGGLATAQAIDIAVDGAGRPWLLGATNGRLGPERLEGGRNWVLARFDPVDGSLL